jgi:hypothetical protein
MKEKAIPRLQTPKTGVSEVLSNLARLPDAPARAAMDRARQIATMLESDRSPAPFVFPTDVGGIQFEWKSDGRELDIEVLPEGTHLSFLTLVGGKVTSEGEIPDNFEPRVRSLLSWMVSPGVTAKPSLAV